MIGSIEHKVSLITELPSGGCYRPSWVPRYLSGTGTDVPGSTAATPYRLRSSCRRRPDVSDHPQRMWTSKTSHISYIYIWYAHCTQYHMYYMHKAFMWVHAPGTGTTSGTYGRFHLRPSFGRDAYNMCHGYKFLELNSERSHANSELPPRIILVIFHKITINLFHLLASLLLSTLNEQSPNQSQVRTDALYMPLSASQSLSREALAVSVLQGFQNSASSHHLVLSDSPDDFTYKCMPLLLLQTFRFSPSLEHVQGRCTLEPAVWSFLGLSFVTAGDVDRMISNAPRNIQCLRQQAQHETWEWALPSHRAESPSTQEQFLHLWSHCNWQGCGEVMNVSLPRCYWILSSIQHILF